jgi:hypothetical protein
LKYYVSFNDDRPTRGDAGAAELVSLLKILSLQKSQQVGSQSDQLR